MTSRSYPLHLRVLTYLLFTWPGRILGVVLALGVVYGVVVLLEGNADRECARTCQAVDSEMRARTNIACVCEDGHTFPAETSRVRNPNNPVQQFGLDD